MPEFSSDEDDAEEMKASAGADSNFIGGALDEEAFEQKREDDLMSDILEVYQEKRNQIEAGEMAAAQ